MEQNNVNLNSQAIVPATESFQEGKLASETYQQWGHRMAGLCNASVNALLTHLQIVYNSIRREQEEKVELQEQLQQDIRKRIASEEAALAQEKEKMEQSKSALQNIKSQIENIKGQIAQLTGQVKQKNSEAGANFIIGLVILLPLTLYLFIFYSSTAYSAFFKEFDYTQSLYSHILDPKALIFAWQQSWTAGLFVLLLPFIFLALGFILHQYTQQEGGIKKYFKVAALVLVTFLFDTLLAFMIAKNMYDAETITIMESRPFYTLAMAFVDARFWIVIFCGFLAYIIWGILFSFVMDNYNKLDLNKVERQNLKTQLASLNMQAQNESNNLASIKSQILTIEGNIATLEASKSNVRRYDTTTILLELNNFFSGWLHYMTAAAMSSAEIDNAQTKFDSFINNIKSVQQ